MSGVPASGPGRFNARTRAALYSGSAMPSEFGFLSLGGTRVGASCYLYTLGGTRLLIDCGVQPGLLGAVSLPELARLKDHPPTPSSSPTPTVTISAR